MSRMIWIAREAVGTVIEIGGGLLKHAALYALFVLLVVIVATLLLGGPLVSAGL